MKTGYGKTNRVMRTRNVEAASKGNRMWRLRFRKSCSLVTLFVKTLQPRRSLNTKTWRACANFRENRFPGPLGGATIARPEFPR